jgi:hypothetical protein
MIAFTLKKDDISPALRRLASNVRPATPILRAMGTTFLGITMGTFNSVGASYRPIPGKAKADETPSILQKSTTMTKAFHLAES